MKPGLKRGGRLKKKKKDGKWIQKANIKKGALRKQLGVKKGKRNFFSLTGNNEPLSVLKNFISDFKLG